MTRVASDRGPARITLPSPSLCVLVGASGSGKSSFAKKHFAPADVLSSDFFRGLVSGDENDQAASQDAFEALHDVLRRRMRRGVFTVVDATNVEEDSRRALALIAKEHDLLASAIVLDVPTDVCHARNDGRPDRRFGRHVVARQRAALRRSIRSLKSEGFHRFTVLDGPEAIDAATIEHVRLWTDRKDDVGPFDAIGDVHGCDVELERLLSQLGYVEEAGVYRHPAGRRVVFLGDLVDRGPGIARCLRIAMAMVRAGTALCILGNHEAKLLRKLRGADVKPSHGLLASIEQLEREPEAFRAEVAEFLDALISHYVLDGGRLVVAHAGLKETFHGRSSGRVREFALYGDTTGEIDSYGLPVRQDWAATYRGRAAVLYGHTPQPQAEWVNGTLCLDTGCVFGGALSALRWPERELVSVPAARVYFEPTRPLARAVEEPRRAVEAALTLSDVVGRRVVETRLHGKVSIREEQAAAALEAMSRFAVDPRWLVYLPPTMSPVEAAPSGELLERPEEAFAHFLEAGAGDVLCEEKHMGSRAIAVVCRDEEVARRRFGDGSRTGVLHSRTGRPFFDDASLEAHVLDAIRRGMDGAGLWDELRTDWIVLDGEILPWSLKAIELLRRQYAPVGAAGVASLEAAASALTLAAARDPSVADTASGVAARAAHLRAFRESYGRYCVDGAGLADVRFAVFHVLASEQGVYDDRAHDWHLAIAGRLAEAAGGVLAATPHVRVALGDAASEAAGVRWWHDITARGAEGMVVKPAPFVLTNRYGLVQPALKVRGREYLRIIYGPEYVEPSRLERLRRRKVGHKRRLALREHALGMEALHRFVGGAPLHRVHECVFGVLALESEPVDPRL